MDASPDVSVVVPVFNGSATVHRVFEAIEETLTPLALRFEVLFVDDGSTDGSWSAIQRLKTCHADAVRGFRLARNCGQQAATYCGLLEVRGAWVVTMDDDMQTHPREIRTLWEQAQRTQADIVYGSYPTLQHGWAHRTGSRVFHAIMRWTAPNFPNGSSFRLIRGDLLRFLPARPGPWILVDPTLMWQTSNVTSVSVEHAPRQEGRSGYALPVLFSMAFTLLVTYSKLPLRLLTAIGLISAVISFGLGIHYLLLKIMVGAQIGFSALIVTITFSSGLILLSLGILGEYISRIHTMASGEPAFTVQSVV
jgi:glycosyltransferase involved in cell wall biosynthesis